jgi:hypothetical protein
MKKQRDRFNSYSLVINPEGAQEHDWVELSKDTKLYLETMLALGFPTPKELTDKLATFRGVAQRSSDPKKVRFCSFTDYFGQLEKGEINMKPHYNLIVRLNVKIYVSVLLRELSQHLYQQDNSYAIQIKPTLDSTALYNYCGKEDTRLILENSPYYPSRVDSRYKQFDSMMGEYPDMEKY